MKRLLALMLAAVMLFALAACNDKGNDKDRDKDDDGGKQNTKKTLSLGVVNGLNYENEFIGIGCTLDSGWTFKSKAEILELNNVVQDAVDEDIANVIKDATIVYDMMASGSNGMDSINVNMEKVNPVQLAALDIPTYYENTMPMLKSALESMGCSNVAFTIDSAQIDGTVFDTLHIRANVNGIALYETLFTIKCNGYLANVTIGTYFEDNTADLLDAFYLVD